MEIYKKMSVAFLVIHASPTGSMNKGPLKIYRGVGTEEKLVG